MRQWEREPVYDGPTYLYTKFTLRARCCYGPGATAFVLAVAVPPKLKSELRAAGIGPPKAAGLRLTPPGMPACAAGPFLCLCP